ncbi:MAG: class I SAM-dependent methyltransferase [Bacteroidales bacterium]|jgi:ubiquinone/menaquinone biosynthesis C-methylase UbiE|nr:class I SAM-dependent methyltransferase [Bacteroidales bacterium]
MDKETSDVSTNQYMGGYSDSIVGAMSERKFAEQAAFFSDYLREDMDVLDCGCGPGTMTVEMANILKKGHVTGIDIHSDQFCIGKKKAEEMSVKNVCFREADVVNLPFYDNKFDAVFAHGLLYHLSDPHSALNEIRRVLKPGGIIAIRDSDFGGEIFTPQSDTLKSAWSLLLKIHEYGGSNPYFGRMQKAELRLAGFDIQKVSASYDSFWNKSQIRQIGTFWSKYLRQQRIKDLILSEKWVCQTELREMSMAFLNWGKNPDSFYASARCETVAQKPDKLK